MKLKSVIKILVITFCSLIFNGNYVDANPTHLQDSIYILVNPNLCSGVLPSYGKLYQEFTINHGIELCFVVTNVRRKNARKTLQKMFGPIPETTNIRVNDAFFWNKAKSFVSGVYSTKTDKYYQGFLHFWEEVNNLKKRDTISIKGADEFTITSIFAIKEGLYKCIDLSNHTWVDIDEDGQVVNTARFADFLEIIREHIGSISPMDYLSTLPNSSLQLDHFLPDKEVYNQVETHGFPIVLKGDLVKTVFRGYEIDPDIDKFEALNKKSFPLRKFAVYVEWNVDNYDLRTIMRLPVLDPNWDYNLSEFLLKEDSTILFSTHPMSELLIESTPVFVRLRKNNMEWHLDTFYDSGLSQLSITTGLFHFIFNPKFCSTKVADYYIDQMEMCFYKIGDTSFRWCIQDLKGTTYEEMMRTLQLNSFIRNLHTKDRFIEFTVCEMRDFVKKDASCYMYQIDLDNQNVIQKNFLYTENLNLSTFPFYHQGRYHKLFVDDEDEQKIVRFY